MSDEDILSHEIARFENLIENRRIPFLSRFTRSKPALFTLVGALFLFQLHDLPERLANSSLDAAISVQKLAPATSVRLVVIDDQDYKDIFTSRSPLDPQKLAVILKDVADGGAKVVIVDLDTTDPTFSSMPVPAIPIVWNTSGDEKNGKFTVDPPLGGRPLPPDSVAALAMAPADDRGVVRGYQHSYPLTTGGTVDSPGYAAARIVGSTHAIKTSQVADANHNADEIHFLDFHYEFPPLRASALHQTATSVNWKQAGLFAGQAVIIGGTYHVARDQYLTPRGLLNGCVIVAQAAAAEIDGTFITPASRWLTGLLMLLGGLITLGVYHWLSFRKAFVLSIILIPSLSIAANFILFHRFAAWGAMIPLVTAVIVAELYSKATLYLAFYQRVARVQTGEPPPSEDGEPAAEPTSPQIKLAEPAPTDQNDPPAIPGPS